MALPLDPVPFLLVLARVAGLVLAAPVFGHVALPRRVRAGLAVVLAAALAPAVPLPATTPADGWTLAGWCAVESALGALVGLVVQFVFAGVQLGGQIAGMQMGFGMANLIDPQSHAQETIVAHWHSLLALLTFLALDGHHLVVRALAASFRAAPPGAAVLSGAGLAAAVGLAADIFTVGLRVAAPVLLVLMLVNGAMGVLARTVPQLNVFVVGFPVTVAVGFAVLGAALPFVLRLLEERFGGLEPALAGLLRGLVHG
jgi:flagellar biosynthetic protein FliR